MKRAIKEWNHSSSPKLKKFWMQLLAGKVMLTASKKIKVARTSYCRCNFTKWQCLPPCSLFNTCTQEWHALWCSTGVVEPHRHTHQTSHWMITTCLHHWKRWCGKRNSIPMKKSSRQSGCALDQKNFFPWESVHFWRARGSVLNDKILCKKIICSGTIFVKKNVFFLNI